MRVFIDCFFCTVEPFNIAKVSKLFMVLILRGWMLEVLRKQEASLFLRDIIVSFNFSICGQLKIKHDFGFKFFNHSKIHLVNLETLVWT